MPRPIPNPEISLIALLGHTDTPVDGVVDYCSHLSGALERLGTRMDVARVPWFDRGWPVAMRRLARESISWQGRWVVLQFTALAWSRHGFPFGVLAVLAVLRSRGVRCAVMFHEPDRHGGSRWIDQARGMCQDWVIRKIYQDAELAIFPDPLPTIPWLPIGDSKSVFIPIGANLPYRTPKPVTDDLVKTVVVFCLSGAFHLAEDLNDISEAIRSATTAGAQIRLLFLGRGTNEARDDIARVFKSIPVEIEIMGLQSPDTISDVLASSDAMLCVRGELYPRRGSAIAGIACGLPIVGYAGKAEGTPLAEAGVVLVPYRDGRALGFALARLLGDADLRRELREKSLRVRGQYFSWDVIAGAYVESLIATEKTPIGHSNLHS
jgi:glycosyltransferase involved in cell wall biosynthesis